MNPRHRLVKRIETAMTDLQVTPWRIYHLDGHARSTPAEIAQARCDAKRLARNTRRLAEGLDALLEMTR